MTRLSKRLMAIKASKYERIDHYLRWLQVALVVFISGVIILKVLA